MDGEPQAVLFANVHLWQRTQPEPAEAAGERRARVKPVVRNQLMWRPVEVEQLIPADHPARAIWELVGQCDLSGFYAKIEAVEGVAGRPAHDPRLLISLLIYGYQEGIPSAREIAERCTYHPAYQWLVGAETICAHSLSDFRTAHGEALKALMVQVLGLLASEGMVDLEQVTQDGTKIRASAGSDTFRRQATLEKQLQQARQRVEELEREDSEVVSQRSIKAQQRAAREQLSRLQKAHEELQKVQAKCSAEDKAEARVSLTDPEARIMKQNHDGGYAPSYNVQFTTDAKHTIIVGVDVTQEGSDAEQLQPAMQRVEEEAGQAPKQVIADSSYTSRENVVKMAATAIDLIGPPRNGEAQKETLYKIRGVAPEFRAEAFAFDAASDHYICPAGKILPYRSKQVEVGQTKYYYTAEAQDCTACAHRGQCCPKSKQRTIARTEEGPEMKAFRAKMETPEAREAYKKRGPVAEFPHLCIKERFGLRQFSVRGLVKVKLEALWVALSFNIQQWFRLCWRPQRLTLT
jgi:transposase